MIRKPRMPKKPQGQGNSQRKPGYWPHYWWYNDDCYYDDWYYDDWYYDDYDWDYDMACAPTPPTPPTPPKPPKNNQSAIHQVYQKGFADGVKYATEQNWAGPEPKPEPPTPMPPKQD